MAPAAESLGTLAEGAILAAALLWRRAVAMGDLRLRGRAVQILRRGVIGSMLVLLVLSLSTITSWASGPSIHLRPSSGPTGSRVDSKGIGFMPGETVQVIFTGKLVARVTADGAGAFTVPFKVPKNAVAGDHTITAKGVSSGLTATATYTVTTRSKRAAGLSRSSRGS